METEPLFINRYTVTKDVLREFQWNAGKFKLALILVSVALGLVAAAALPGIIEGTGGTQLILLIIAAVCEALYVVAFFATVNRVWKQVCEQANGKPVEAVISFFEENTVNETIGWNGRVVLEYSSIKKVIVTKNLIILLTRAKIGHILRRDSFVKGAEEEFLKFINTKVALNKLK